MDFNKKMIMEQSIGVFDSGVGGLTALRKLAELLPTENMVYLGDTARVPYGNRSVKTIRYYAQQCVEFLHQHQVKLILVACNTVSSVALAEIEKMSSVPVVGVIEPASAAALQAAKNKKIGIIGTYATVKSQAYTQAIYHMADKENVTVISQACPLFVPLIEEGWHEHDATYMVAREYLLPLQKANIDSLILGCTHYPLLKKVIHDIMPSVQLIDSGEEAALKAAQLIKADQKQEVLSPPQPISRSIECYMTDITTTSMRFAQQLLGVSQEAVHHISIEKSE